MENSDYSILLLPENTNETIPCLVNLIRGNSLICDVEISRWNEYREEKIITSVSLMLKIFLL